MGKVIIVTGTPGTGKTTFAKALVSAIGADYVNLTQYVTTRKLYRGIDRERRTKIIDMARTRTSLKKTLSAIQGPAVVDTHIPDGILPKELVSRVFVLRCHPRILEARLRSKKWKLNKIRENIVAEIVDSCLIAAIGYYGREKVIQFDTSHANMRDCVALAERFMLGKSTKTRIKIDWLAQLEKEGMPSHYLT